MAGRAEQRRRESHVKREVDQKFRRALAILESGDLDLLRGYLQSELGMTKPFEEVRRELKESRERIH